MAGAPPAPPARAAAAPKEELPCLFWDDSSVVDPDHPDMAALLALKEEETPEERAEAKKARH